MLLYQIRPSFITQSYKIGLSLELDKGFDPLEAIGYKSNIDKVKWSLIKEVVAHIPSLN